MPNRIPNSLLVARLERGLSRKQVSVVLSTLFDYQGTSSLAAYEQGALLPPLKTALCLEILYRRPAAYLWGGAYTALQEKIRSLEKGEEERC
jgi:hypothetical protein